MQITKSIHTLAISTSVITLMISAPPAFSQSNARDVTGNLPGFIKQPESRSRGRPPCPQPLQLRWKALFSPNAPSMPYRDPGDNPIAGTRAFGDMAINKLFSHTFLTGSFKQSCCYIPRNGRAYLAVYGAGSANENLFIGDVPRNDLFGTYGAGAMYNPPVSSLPFGTNSSGNFTGNFIWRAKPISPVNVSSNDRFSYAIGDDLKIRQTALFVQTCCIGRERHRRGNNANILRRNNAASNNAFRNMLQKDGARRVNPTPRPSEPARMPAH